MSKHHGLSKTRIYRTWGNMKSRCHKEYDSKYKYYGAKGIKVCDEWRNNFMSFYNWAIKNGYTDELTIDRIDSTKDYCPENCRWVTLEQNIVYSHNKKHKPSKNKKTLDIFQKEEYNKGDDSELKKLLKQNGCYLHHEGRNHESWYSPITNKTFPVGRHKTEEVAQGTLKAILKQAGIN